MTKQLFFDTSALVKLYHQEEGTAVLDNLLAEEQFVIVISDLCIIEMVSALAKKVRTEEITAAVFEAVVTAFEEDVLGFEVLHISQEEKHRAVELLKSWGLEEGLRTLDALQLASALTRNMTTSLDLFVAADSTLVSVAKKESLPVLLVQR
ncbi:PIN domain-containing protein [Candidatus Peregrinibacteria bacterium]|nr:PIN domain-containing protein [Candidatus Peregrinibacteria bacterium]